MRGFYLYAALVGFLIVGITVAYSLYLNSQEAGRVKMLLELEKRSRYIPYIDIMREESFASTSAVFRRSLELYLRRYPIYIPKEAYDRDEALEWMEENFFRDKTVSGTVAAYLYAELRSYTALRIKGTVQVMGSDRAISDAIREGVHLIMRNDSVIIVFDPSKMDQSVLQSLPSLKVCEGGYCRTLTVFPEEKTEITVPLRLKRAVENAQEVYDKLKYRMGDMEFSAGFCKENCAACGVFRFDGDMELVYPESEEDPCRETVITLERMESKDHYYRALGIEGGGCANEALKWGDKYIPCSDPKTILLNYYQKELNEVQRDVKGNLFFDARFLDEKPTKLLKYQKVIDMSILLASSTMIPPELLEFLGINVHGDYQLAPLGSCKVVGEAYCAYPRRIVLEYAWTDKDSKYSVLGAPMTYTFFMDFGEPKDMIDYLNAQEAAVKGLKNEAGNTMGGANQEMCEERLQNMCTVDYITNHFSDKCPGIGGDSLEALKEWVKSNGDENCQSAVNWLIGDDGACWDITKACSQGISLGDLGDRDKCIKTVIEGCMTGLLQYKKCVEVSDCSYNAYTDLLNGNLFPRIGLDTDTKNNVANEVWEDLGEENSCIADMVAGKYFNGNAGSCNEEINHILSTCLDPNKVCGERIRPIQTSEQSAICHESSGQLLESTYNYNIFDPTYLAVGCYTT